jgi:succinoglycan biosynthesis protein ExoW
MQVAVIIPFYQRAAHILGRAILSVGAQEVPEGVTLQIVVVDDGSPVPAGEEVAALPPGLRQRVTIITQPNGGPGAARNRALDWVAGQAGQVDVVAFLDSDDTWAPRHIADALACLALGHDLYFCNHRRFEDTETYFDLVPDLREIGRDDRPGVAVLTEAGPVLSLTPEALLTLQIITYPSQTSTVVIRAERVLRQRFDRDLRRAGEDHLFWVAIAADRPRTAMSWRCNVRCGRGVNVYFGAQDWGSARVVERVGDVLMFHQKAAAFDLPARDRRLLHERTRHYARGYSFHFLRALLLGRRPSFRQFRRLVRMSPDLLLWMPGRFLRVMVDRRPEARFW